MLIALSIIGGILLLAASSALSWFITRKFYLKELAILRDALTASKKLPPPVPSLELKEFLSDLQAGIAMLAVTRMNPNDILLRSPRDQR